MANHKDAAKRARQALVRRERNRSYRTAMRNRIKAVRAAVADARVDADFALEGAALEHVC